MVINKLILGIGLLVFAANIYAQQSDFAAIDFHKADSLALVYKNERLTNLPELCFKLTDGLDTDVERFRAVYRWICNNIANDYNLYKRNMYKRHRFREDSIKLKAWNKKFQEIAIQKLLKRKRAICTGYAYLLQHMAAQIGLHCEIVNGYARTSTTEVNENSAPNHSWNAVLLNEKWYLCDATWSAGVPDPETGMFTFYYNDGFFLGEPQLFALNHFPIDTQWLLLNKSDYTFTDFLEAPVFYGGTYSVLAHFQQPEKMHHELLKGESLHYWFTLRKPVAPDKIILKIDSGSGMRAVTLDEVNITDEIVDFSYRFEHRGFYDVHLYIDGVLIATHTVRVLPAKTQE